MSIYHVLVEDITNETKTKIKEKLESLYLAGFLNKTYLGEPNGDMTYANLFIASWKLIYKH